MPKNPDLEKHTINLRSGDYAFLATICEPRGIPVAQLIRTIISDFVDKKRAHDKPLQLLADD